MKDLEERLVLLRDYVGVHEREIRGKPAIVDYLISIGVKTTLGKTPTVHVLNSWITKRRFPAVTLRRSDKVLTTNLLVCAWLWSYVTYQKSKPWVQRKWKPAVYHPKGPHVRKPWYEVLDEVLKETSAL